MILAESDLPIYAPAVTLTGDALTGALLRVQAIAESALGANRPLELQAHTELLHLNTRLQTARFTRYPVAIAPVPVLEVRSGNFRNVFRRSQALSPWYTLQPSDVIIDYETGQINFAITSNISFGRVGIGYYANQCRATYYSGFDFTLDTASVREIKSTVGNLLSYLFKAEGGSATAAGGSTDSTKPTGAVKSVEIDGEYTLQFDTNTFTSPYQISGGNTTYESIVGAILMPLKKYQPRSW